MGFVEAVQSCLKNYANFEGRAARSEYWFWTLFTALYSLLFFVPLLGMVFMLGYLGLIVPALAVTIRRLHDTNRSGWWFLLAIVPLAGLVLLFWFCIRGTAGENRFGPDPLGPDVVAVFS